MHRCDANSPLTYRAPNSKNSIIIQLSLCFPSQPLQQPLSHKIQRFSKGYLEESATTFSPFNLTVHLCETGVRLYHSPYEM